jgi:hypothetical protein
VAAGQSRATGSSGSGSAERAVQDPSLGGRAGRRPGGEVGGTRKTGGVGEVTENPPQRRGAALLASGERRLGSGGVPDAGDVAGDLAVSEVAEDRMDPESGTAGEIEAPPVSPASMTGSHLSHPPELFVSARSWQEAGGVCRSIADQAACFEVRLDHRLLF